MEDWGWVWVINLSMDQNIQSIIPQREVQGENESNKEKQKVVELVQRFVLVASDKLPQIVKQLRKGNGFTLLKTAESLVSLNNLTNQCFDMTLIQFEKEMSRAGFKVRNKVQEGKEALKSVYRLKETFHSVSSVEQDSQSNVSKQEAEKVDQQIKKQEIKPQVKDEREFKPAKPDLMIGRFQSDNMLGASTKKRPYDDDSIQMKLYEQDLFSTPAAHRKDTSNINQIDQEEAESAPIAQKNTLYRENYEKCSKLIDNAMIQILTAHRGKKIGERAEELLGKVVEIYDILSDNIENVNSTIRAVGRGEERKESVSSPGFKPLNGLNDNLK